MTNANGVQFNRSSVEGKPDGNRHRRFGKTRLMPLIHVSWKIKTDTKPLRQQIARFLRKQLDSLFCGESLGGFFFLLFGFLDRIAHVAGVLSIEGMLGGH